MIKSVKNNDGIMLREAFEDLNRQEINDQLSYILQFDNADKISVEHLISAHSERAHCLIQFLRDDKDKLVNNIRNKALQLVEFMIAYPSYSFKLIWIIRDFLGHKADSFSIINFSGKTIDYIKKEVSCCEYCKYPYVILARYIQPEQRKSIVPLIIEYADNKDSRMSWAMTGEACTTLAFLNSIPQESIKCLGRHLNDGGCDGMPTDNILYALPFFKEYGNIIIDDLIKYLTVSSIGAEYDEIIYDFEQLSFFVTSQDVATKLIPAVSERLKTYKYEKILKDGELFEIYAKPVRITLMFYGQLQAVSKGIFSDT